MEDLGLTTLDRSPGKWKAYAWVLILPVAFLLYSTSFNTYDVIRQEHSVLGDADASNYIRLIENFGLTEIYGDPYTHTSEGRSIGDNAQKHKIHHVLYVTAAAAIYSVLDAVYGALGISGLHAVYSVNAAVVCLNIVLVYLLLNYVNPKGNPRLPFLLFYATALSTWIFASMPDSWPFTGTLILLFLLVYYKKSPHDLALAALIGFLMLGNLILVFLLVFLLIRMITEGHRWRAVLIKSLTAGSVAMGTWLVLLTALSLIDPFFRPDHYARYTLWYKDFVNLDLTILSPYVWKSVVTNLYVTSIVSNQPDPFVPQEALLYTVRGSVLGLVALAAYLLLVAVVLVAAARELRPAVAQRGIVAGAVADRGLHLATWCAAMVPITIFLYYASGFIYSTTIVGLMAVILCRFLNLANLWHKLLFYGVLLIMVVNNSVQVIRFREALAAL